MIDGLGALDKNAGRAEVTTADLLVALVAEHGGVASRILADLGVGLDAVAGTLTGESA